MSTTMVPAQEEVAQEMQREAHVAQQAATQLARFVVETQPQIEIASKLLVDLHDQQKRITSRKEEITKPLNAALKSVRDLFAPAENAYKDAVSILKQKIGAAQLAIRTANEEAMRATQAALAAGDVRTAALTSGAITPTDASKGVAYREEWVFRIVNASLLPRDFLMPDEKRIKEHVSKFGLSSPIPGVHVEKSVGVRMTGR